MFLDKAQRYGEAFRDVMGQEFSSGVDDREVPAEKIREVVSPDLSKQERVQVLMSFLHSKAPEGISKVLEENFGYRFRSVPFNLPEGTDATDVIGSGGINRVYLLEARDPSAKSWVLKLPRLKQKSPENYIKEQRAEVEEIRQKFSSLPQLVLPENYLIMEGLHGKPTAAVIQEYKGSIKDIYKDLTKEELSDLIQENDSFGEQLRLFVDTFRSDPELLEKELDIWGYRNLCVIEEEEGPRLLLVDPHYRSQSARSPETSKKIDSLVTYLEEVSQLD